MSGRPAPLRGTRAFAELRAGGRRARSGAVTVQFAPANDGEVRVAYAIARRVGGAVVRNRWRRRLRAIAAALSAELPAGSYLITLQPSVNSLDFEQLREQVDTTMRKATRTRQ